MPPGARGELRVLVASNEGCVVRRMPRMQVYLPEAMYEQVKARALPVSELLQKAVLAELRRQDLLAATDRHLAGLVAKFGEPTAAEQARADALVRGATERRSRKGSARKAG